MRLTLFRPGPRSLPEGVRASLVSRFKVDAGTVNRVRLVSKGEDGKGTAFRIYDPSLVSAAGSRVKAYEDLTNLKEAILFEGRIETGGAVYLADRRPPKTVARRPSHIPAPSPKPEQAS